MEEKKPIIEIKHVSAEALIEVRNRKKPMLTVSDGALIEVKNISKYFQSVIALSDINMVLYPGEVMCLLGDNGAGKSTLIKILSGAYTPSEGEYFFQGVKSQFYSPREALDKGIATVYQDLAMIPLASITRNFFMGREPVKGWGPFKFFDFNFAHKVTREQMHNIGIDIRNPDQAVGTLSGGERQCLAISRAVYFGAKVLILDEPTSALGVSQASMVLKYILRAKKRGIGVIFITHNVHHAYPIADRFTLLNRGKSLGTFKKNEVLKQEVLDMMAGGKELQDITKELETEDKGSDSQVLI